MPLEYDKIKDLPYWEQIAGQIYYLTKFYTDEMARQGEKQVVKISYQDMCSNPMWALEEIQDKMSRYFDYAIKISKQPPAKFDYSTYVNKDKEKAKFEALLQQFEKNQG